MSRLSRSIPVVCGYDSSGRKTRTSTVAGRPFTGSRSFDMCVRPLLTGVSDTFHGPYARACAWDADGLDCWFDDEDRLVSVFDESAYTETFSRYDHLHRRVARHILEWSPDDASCVTNESRVFDGWNPVFERTFDGWTGEPVSDTVYVWGADLSGSLQGAGGVGGLLAVQREGTWYAPLYDANGHQKSAKPKAMPPGDRDFIAVPRGRSEERYPATQRQLYVTAYVSETGAVVAEYEYDAFGNTISQSGALSDSFRHRFSTKPWIAALGVYDYGERLYSPELRRWLSRDPIDEDGGVNLYAMCHNNTHLYFDPNGQSFEDVSNFCAGVGDSMTFGLTRLFRKGINRIIVGTWDDTADVESSAYKTGEFTEVTVEIVVTLGTGALRHTAKSISRKAIEEGARSSYRRTYNLIGKGGEVHHINPIKGHPNGKTARIPLPYEWAARGKWNMTWYPTRAEHRAAHARQQILEAIDRFRESTIIVRQGTNKLINYLNSPSGTRCWDSIDVRTNILQIEYGSCGHANAVPESVSIQIDQLLEER